MTAWWDREKLTVFKIVIRIFLAIGMTIIAAIFITLVAIVEFSKKTFMLVLPVILSAVAVLPVLGYITSKNVIYLMASLLMFIIVGLMLKIIPQTIEGGEK